MTFRIEWAPLNIPFERRLQTLAAAFWFHLLGFGGGFILAFLYYLFCYTRFWWITVLYAAWIYIDRKTPEQEGRRVEYFRKLKFWGHVRNYFPMKLHKMPGVQFDSSKNYLFCYFPHGLLTVGAISTFCTEKGEFTEFFPNLKPHLCGLTQFFYLPIVRELMMSLGARAPSAESLRYLLSKPEGGQAVGLVVGGSEEAYYAKPNQYKLVLKNRKGFAKVALRNGSPLVPVFSFGENDVFNQLDLGDDSWLRRCQKAIKKAIGFPLVIPYGRGYLQYTFGFVPYRRPINVIVGHPIPVKKTENPTQSEVDDLHKKFVDDLVNIFESQKHKYVKDADNVHIELI